MTEQKTLFKLNVKLILNNSQQLSSGNEQDLREFWNGSPSLSCNKSRRKREAHLYSE